MQLDIGSIVIPESRQRSEVAGISDLAVSLQSHGQFHPVLVRRMDDGKWELISGFRRLMAAKSIKWENIEAKAIAEADELERREIELDENLMRQNLTWQEEVKAKKDLYDLRRTKYGDDFRGTAEHIGISTGGLWEDVELGRAAEHIPELMEAKTKSAGRSKLRRVKQRLVMEELAKRSQEGSETFGEVSNHVHLGDCISVLKDFASGCASLLLTDPPYGINLDSGETKKGSTHAKIYEDDTYDIMDMLRMAFREAYRVLGDNSHAYVWFDIKAHALILDMLKEVGFEVDAIPLIWVKPGPGQVNHPASRWGSAYEACFFCRKGARALLKQGQGNVMSYEPVPGQKKIHPTEKPTALLRQLIESSTVEGETVLDIFGGSGSTGEAAIQTGRNYILIEKDEGYYGGILSKLSKYESKTTEAESQEEEDKEE